MCVARRHFLILRVRKITRGRRVSQRIGEPHCVRNAIKAETFKCLQFAALHTELLSENTQLCSTRLRGVLLLTHIHVGPSVEQRQFIDSANYCWRTKTMNERVGTKSVTFELCGLRCHRHEWYCTHDFRTRSTALLIWNLLKILRSG